MSEGIMGALQVGRGQPSTRKGTDAGNAFAQALAARAASACAALKSRLHCKSGADQGGLTHIVRLLHQTSRIGGKAALQRGLKIHSNFSVKYDAALATKRGKKFFTHWWSANNRKYKPFKTTIYPEKKKYKCAKSMGIASNFAALTKGKNWDLFLLSKVKRPLHRSPLQSVCLALAEQGSKAAAHLRAESKLVPSNGNGGFILNNETGHAIVEMRLDHDDDETKKKEWSFWASDSTRFNDRVNLCFAFDDAKTIVPPKMLSNDPTDDAWHCQYGPNGWGYTKYMYAQADDSLGKVKMTKFMQPQGKVPGIISNSKFLQP